MLQIVVIRHKVCLGFLKKQTQRQGFAWKWPLGRWLQEKGKWVPGGKEGNKGCVIEQDPTSATRAQFHWETPGDSVGHTSDIPAKGWGVHFPNPMLTVWGLRTRSSASPSGCSTCASAGKAQGQEVTGSSQRPLPTSNETKGHPHCPLQTGSRKAVIVDMIFCWFIYFFFFLVYQWHFKTRGREGK